MAVPSHSCRWAVTARLQVIGVCPELRCAFKFEEDKVLSSNMWHVLRANSWDNSTVEMLGSVRPLALYMAMITKIVDGASCRTLLNQGAFSRLRMAASQESCTSIRYTSSRSFSLPLPIELPRILSRAFALLLHVLSQLGSSSATMSSSAWTLEMQTFTTLSRGFCALPMTSSCARLLRRWSPAGRMGCSDG
jgi:hypothetical protein